MRRINLRELPIPDAREIDEVVEAIRPMLAGRHPAIQGGALADLLAMWLAGHPKPYREDILRSHLNTVRDLTPINAKILGTEP